mmetsp:Transcript_14164/g.42302  ORF Transcript_14164/g.42302 Transcript_14164/m.42302 type:complete len:497 (-) Transcript_14164:28-1518(-)
MLGVVRRVRAARGRRNRHRKRRAVGDSGSPDAPKNLRRARRARHRPARRKNGAVRGGAQPLPALIRGEEARGVVDVRIVVRDRTGGPSVKAAQPGEPRAALGQIRAVELSGDERQKSRRGRRRTRRAREIKRHALGPDGLGEDADGQDVGEARRRAAGHRRRDVVDASGVRRRRRRVDPTQTLRRGGLRRGARGARHRLHRRDRQGVAKRRRERVDHAGRQRRGRPAGAAQDLRGDPGDGAQGRRAEESARPRFAHHQHVARPLHLRRRVRRPGAHRVSPREPRLDGLRRDAPAERARPRLPRKVEEGREKQHGHRRARRFRLRRDDGPGRARGPREVRADSGVRGAVPHFDADETPQRGTVESRPDGTKERALEAVPLLVCAQQRRLCVHGRRDARNRPLGHREAHGRARAPQHSGKYVAGGHVPGARRARREGRRGRRLRTGRRARQASSGKIRGGFWKIRGGCRCLDCRRAVSIDEAMHIKPAFAAYRALLGA